MIGGSSGRAAVVAMALGALLVLVGPTCSLAQPELFLYRQAGIHVLREGAPLAGDATFSSSRPVSLVGGNAWMDLGTWTGRLAIDAPVFVLSVSDLHVWLGLITSADIATPFDLEAEVWVKGGGSEARVGQGLQRCITGLARGASLAQEAVVPFVSTPAAFEGGAEWVRLRLRTRIGTNSQNRRCTGGGPGQASAFGLRIYHGGTDQPSSFGLAIALP